VSADQIIFCADKLQPALTEFSQRVYHAQTFLSISEPLNDRDVERLFPGGPVQCWDTDLVYSYYRMTGDQRLLLGGGSALTTFALHSVTSPRVISQVIGKFKGKFPYLRDLEFIQYWPGLIDTTRDLIPTIVKDPDMPWVHFVLGCVGLPWAAFCGDFVARHVHNEPDWDDHHYYHYFRPDRPFLIPLGLEKIIGKPLAFALNNAWSKYRQVDKDFVLNPSRGDV
jgi:gamma-glutamylputrescine oxidase